MGNRAARWEAVQIRNVACELSEQGSLPERFVAVLERITARPCEPRTAPARGS